MRTNVRKFHYGHNWTEYLVSVKLLNKSILV